MRQYAVQQVVSAPQMAQQATPIAKPKRQGNKVNNQIIGRADNMSLKVATPGSTQQGGSFNLSGATQVNAVQMHTPANNMGVRPQRASQNARTPNPQSQQQIYQQHPQQQHSQQQQLQQQQANSPPDLNLKQIQQQAIMRAQQIQQTSNQPISSAPTQYQQVRMTTNQPHVMQQQNTLDSNTQQRMPMTTHNPRVPMTPQTQRVMGTQNQRNFTPSEMNMYTAVSQGNASQCSPMPNSSQGQGTPYSQMQMTPQGQVVNHMSAVPSQSQINQGQRMVATPRAQMAVNNLGASQGSSKRGGRGRGQGQIRAPQQQLFQHQQQTPQNQQKLHNQFSSMTQPQMVQSQTNTAMMNTPQSVYARLPQASIQNVNTSVAAQQAYSTNSCQQEFLKSIQAVGSANATPRPGVAQHVIPGSVHNPQMMTVQRPQQRPQQSFHVTHPAQTAANAGVVPGTMHLTPQQQGYPIQAMAQTPATARMPGAPRMVQPGTEDVNAQFTQLSSGSDTTILNASNQNNLAPGSEYLIQYSNGRKVIGVWDGKFFKVKNQVMNAGRSK